MKYLIVSPNPVRLILVDEEDLEAELEALGDDVAMEEELKTEEGAIPRYVRCGIPLN